jgi:hypothetical protein
MDGAFANDSVLLDRNRDFSSDRKNRNLLDESVVSLRLQNGRQNRSCDLLP